MWIQKMTPDEFGAIWTTMVDRTSLNLGQRGRGWCEGYELGLVSRWRRMRTHWRMYMSRQRGIERWERHTEMGGGGPCWSRLCYECAVLSYVQA